MPTRALPTLVDIESTRDALHAYARVLGDWLKACRARRRHWWHASLRPSIHGLTTGVVHAGQGFSFELNLLQSRLHAWTASGDEASTGLRGQPASAVAHFLTDFARAHGLPPDLLPEKAGADSNGQFKNYSVAKAAEMAAALHFVGAALERLRAGMAEEASPIQVWPHHFDLSMLWLPGGKIRGQDPADEEASDKQLNFGFVFGDEAISRPYFYITAYPFPSAMTKVRLPEGASWQSEAFEGAVLSWDTLLEQRDPAACLDELFRVVLDAGRRHLVRRGRGWRSLLPGAR